MRERLSRDCSGVMGRGMRRVGGGGEGCGSRYVGDGRGSGVLRIREQRKRRIIMYSTVLQCTCVIFIAFATGVVLSY